MSNMYLQHMTPEEKKVYNAKYYQDHKDYWVRWRQEHSGDIPTAVPNVKNFPKPDDIAKIADRIDWDNVAQTTWDNVAQTTWDNVKTQDFDKVRNMVTQQVYDPNDPAGSIANGLNQVNYAANTINRIASDPRVAESVNRLSEQFGIQDGADMLKSSAKTVGDVVAGIRETVMFCESVKESVNNFKDNWRQGYKDIVNKGKAIFDKIFG